MDLFPMGSPLPYRIDLLDNEIETIRTFDVDTQRSVYPVTEIRLLPAREFPSTKKPAVVFEVVFANISKAIHRKVASIET